MKDAKAADRFMGLKTALANGLDPNLVKESSRGYSLIDRHLRHLRPVATLLHWALEKLDFEAANYLLEHGAEIDLCNHEKLTVLHEVILDENEEAVAFLLERGANPNKRYPDGNHPLCLALAITHVAIFRLLVDAMSDLTTASVDKWTIVDFALLSGDHQALEILFQRDPSLKPSPWTCAELRDAPEEWTGPSSAKQLLAICTSSLLIPPSELYDIYAHVLLSRTEMHYVESGTINPTLLIKDVFQALFDAACITMPTSRVTLCQSCLSFQDFARLPSKSRRWFCIHQSRGELDECAKSCPFCRLVADAFDNADNCARKDDLCHNEGRCGGSLGHCQFCREEKAEKKNDHVSVPKDMAVTGIRLQLRHDAYYPLDPDEHTFFIAQDQQNMLTAKLPVDGIDETYLLDINNSVGLDASTGSRQTFDIAARWLDKCRNSSSHEDCQKAYPDGGDILGPQLPTRILDLTSFPNPRLVETGGTRSPYCALSYCWGDMGTNITTTRGNVSEHMEGIPTKSIPVFIQEAIIAARTLGYRYIWIDALCIIQDDPDDWDREASKMKDVYANADLTLSSLVARGCHEHLFHSRGVMTTRPIPFDIWTPKDRRPRWEKDVIHQYAVYPSFLINNDGDPEGFSGGDNVASRAPITSRGWVLQEQMLSTRMLYFGSSYILWECLCLATTDLDPSKIISPRTSGGLGSEAERKYAVQGVTYPTDYYDYDDLRHQPYGIWQSLLTSYTKRRLTKSSDRIPAFLAISKALESTIGGEFIGGVWKGEKLLESLSWNVREADDRQPKAPSWSWVSVNQTIEFDCLSRGYELAESTSLATLVSFDVQTNHSQSYVSGSITLKGTLHQKDIDLSSEDSKAFFDYRAGTVDHCYALDLVGFDRSISDDYMEDSDGDEMEWDEDSLPTVVVRLLLEPVDQSASPDLSCAFRRIGICRDEGDRNQVLEDTVLPRTDTGTAGIWNGIKWSKANRVITIV
ncbi:uncharacterized protein FTOL_03588 [Fusarium torulosum]|uniref:Heterokaryon incompatibility domain-containing protein n=1 Tax=Fusarium torulosum TaxID=33205 RepID=A0AAE8SFD8_9HYPO|nr:uncharacterized protein FTOL_03588 [Fusarium torulosum]